MKLRIVEKNGLYIPQHYNKTRYYYGSSWKGFGTPNIKFTKPELAKKFIELIDMAVPSVKNAAAQKVIYKNFKDNE